MEFFFFFFANSCLISQALLSEISRTYFVGLFLGSLLCSVPFFYVPVPSLTLYYCNYVASFHIGCSDSFLFCNIVLTVLCQYKC